MRRDATLSIHFRCSGLQSRVLDLTTAAELRHSTCVNFSLLAINRSPSFLALNTSVSAVWASGTMQHSEGTLGRAPFKFMQTVYLCFKSKM